MKIAVAQLNPTVGALGENTDQILRVIAEYRHKADIVVFPEMTLTGYPPQDLLLETRFIAELDDKIRHIAAESKGIPVILGTVRQENGKLRNTAAVIAEGKVIAWRDKTLLPTYDVFDEARYFQPAGRIEPVSLNVAGKLRSIGIEICEDLWDQDYSTKVTSELVDKGADLIINISASPFSVNRLDDRIELVGQKVAALGRPFLYCNLIGAQDELVFDGGSFFIDRDGQLSGAAPQFKSGVFLFDAKTTQPLPAPGLPEEEQIFRALSLGVSDYFRKTGHGKAVLGLSGGIDSALVAVIASDALGKENVLGITMPSIYSSGHSIEDSKKLAENLGIEFEMIPIRKINEEMLTALAPVFRSTKAGLAEENLQARIRGGLLMAVANKRNALLLNTGNKTETALGYCTLYGDMCGALGVISDLNKLQVYAVARWYNRQHGADIIPQNTLTKPPSAELKPDQVDPFDYNLIAPLVDEIVTGNKHLTELVKQGYDQTIVAEILRKIRLNEYKRRQAAPGIRISRKAFGVGRCYPIVNGFGESQ
ncbi:MAG: NAD+ synthase [FCB group bacterium]|nr:NAD+ synthase [FCB group bacterium]